MRLLFQILICAVFLSGCYSSHERPETDGLAIYGGSTEPLILMPGQNGVQLFSALLVSHSRRPIIALGIQVDAHGVLLDRVDGDVVNVRLMSGDGRLLSVVRNFAHSDFSFLFFDDEILVEPMEELELILVVDLTETASNRVMFDWGEYVPGHTSSTCRTLFTVIMYGDTGDMVPLDLVTGNEGYGRHVIIE